MTKLVTLTQIETIGIQDYIFGSNNLRQNVGASELVARSTTHWIAQVLDGQSLHHNATWIEQDGHLDLADRSIAQDGVDAEVVYAGGGNALILFAGKTNSLARSFTSELTFRILERARGLALVVDHVEFDLEDSALSNAHRQLRRKVAGRKMKSPVSLPIPGRAVTAACVFTGQPAVGVNDDDNPISEQVRCTTGRGFELAEARLNNILSLAAQSGYEFARDFDNFGEKGESSYIAVVHADGNGMGKRFKALADAHPRVADNASYVRQLRAFSQAMRQRSIAALRETVQLLIASRRPGEDGEEKFGGVVPIPRKKNSHTGRIDEFLPFRPIVFGGDDVTFVAEGRLGLALAAKYLDAVSQGPLPGASEAQVGEPLYSRAGVAVVKSHYPFSRAYELAEDLADSAKDSIDYLVDGTGTVMDWHFSTSGVIHSLKEVRGHEYMADTGQSLLMRPVRLNLGAAPPPGSKYWRSWDTFTRLAGAFQGGQAWHDRRNKIKALQGALRRGPSDVEIFRSNYGIEELPEIEGQSTMKTTGWAASECGYFDAIEALDFFVSLSNEKEATT